MKQARWGGVLLLMLAVSGCRHHQDMAQPATQENFGVQMARSNLWREAMFRFRRAVELEPASAMAHNNLAVALEANGDFDNAAKEYREALRLDRSNQYIQKNYSRFVEFLARNKKRQQRTAGVTAATTIAATTTAAPQTSAQPAPGPASAPPATSTTPPPPAQPAPAPPTPNPPHGGSR
ncbi:MAG: tetratricopeptide repeat protein [Thermoanaerobaculia bacterium]